MPRGLVPALDRLRVLDRDEATLAKLDRAVTELRSEHPNEPILVAADYIQATPAAPGQERSHVAGVSSDLRRMAKKLDAVILAVSQASTSNSRALRDGTKVGIDAASTGAETAQIERDSYVILALGDQRPGSEPGYTRWKLSTAKQRMGTSDMVREVEINGRTGTWSVIGEARPAADAKAEKQASTEDAKVRTLVHAIPSALQKAPEPMSRRELRAEVGGSDGNVRAAVRLLLDDEASGVVEVGPKVGGSWRLWSRARASKAGLPIVPRLAGEGIP